MQTNREYKGEWFLPTDKTKRVIGTLYFDPENGGRLELIGSFLENLFTLNSHEVDFILGISSDGECLTLHNCFISKRRGKTYHAYRETGKPTVTYVVNYILEGAHFENLDQLAFNEIGTEINNLDEWLSISGFVNDFDVKKFKRNEFELKYKLPAQIDFNLNDNLTGCIHFKSTTPQYGFFESNVVLTQSVEFRLISKDKFGLLEGLKQLFKFQNFIVMGLYQHTHPQSISFYQKEIFDNEETLVEIKLFYKISKYSKRHRNKSFNDMLFTYHDIKGTFTDIIKKWYEKYELLEPAFNLVFENFYNDQRFTTNAFLNFAQAAETFHSRTNNHTKLPKEEFDEMKISILKVVDAKYHAWLNDQFNFGNNLNLATRLTEMCDKYSNKILDKIIGGKEIFVKQVRDSRNYYTHYSQDKESKALKDFPLFVLTEKIKILLISAFLLEIGFEKDLIEKLLKNKEYQFFHHLIKF